MRPLIVFSLISVLLLTFYIREGEAGPIHAVRSGVTTITSPVRFVGSAVAVSALRRPRPPHGDRQCVL